MTFEKLRKETQMQAPVLYPHEHCITDPTTVSISANGDQVDFHRGSDGSVTHFVVANPAGDIRPNTLHRWQRFAKQKFEELDQTKNRAA